MKLDLPKTAISGRFQIIVSSDAEMKNISHDTGVFNNLITDDGLNRIGLTGLSGVAQICGRFVVGSGNTPPRFTDTALVAPVAYANGDVTVESNISSAELGYSEQVVRFQFGQGVAAGNLSEIGMQHTSASGVLWSRALILDGAGNPTTITVTASDFLTCFYTIRVAIPRDDFVFPINVVVDDTPVPTTVTTRACSANRSDISTGWGLTVGTVGGGSSTAHTAYTGGLAPITATSPQGSSVGATNTGGFTQDPYVTDSHQKYLRRTEGLNFYNGTFATVRVANLLGAWQVNFDPPLTKDNTQTIEWAFGFSWARGT